VRAATKESNRESGFTLLEIMVVITIVALMASAVVLTIPDSKSAVSQYHTPKAQLAALLRSLAQRAQLKQQWHGLYFVDNSYQAMIFSTREWLFIADKKPVELTPEQSYSLLIDNKIIDTRSFTKDYQTINKSPQILISPAGIYNHFELRFGDDQSTQANLSDPYASL